MHYARLLYTTIALSIAATTAHAATEDVATTIKRQAQEFSDGYEAMDTDVLKRLVADDAVIVNSWGDVETKELLIHNQSFNYTGPTVKSEHTLEGLTVSVKGGIAVASFVDVSVMRWHGQALTSKNRSTEVWRSDNGDWKMIASQTGAVPENPPAVALPESVMKEYAGRYQADSGYILTIAYADGGLTGQMGGLKTSGSYPIKAELKDVLFTPGLPTLRRIVQRDADGVVTGIVARHSDGSDLVLTRLP